MGHTASEATVWVSITGAACRTASATLTGDLLLAVTAGERVGSGSGGISYAVGAVSAVTTANMVESGGISVSLLGVGLGRRRYLLLSRYKKNTDDISKVEN